MQQNTKTIGELRSSGYRILPVKDEMRKNLISKLRNRETLFPGIIGFDDTVIPQVVNAVLARHDMILLGLRGQAKTRMARMMTNLLDEYVPIVRGSELNDNPFQPISRHALDLVNSEGDHCPIEWIHRSERYGEKLATPDVTIADLIGDIDPIKAATQRLHYSHEGAIHFGIIPRTNRGIFVINEIPDLQPRIQVGLFNILQERDIQIRGFNIRIPLDVCIVFTANPEDYTRRGSIITPLKDRIDAQILTHYPKTLGDGIAITQTEAWTNRTDVGQVEVSDLFREIVESVAHEARGSEFVDQSSGVSARMTISMLEALVSNAERRALLNSTDQVAPRIVDLLNALTGVTGKVELVFEGEQEGAQKVAKALLGKAVRTVFLQYFTNPLARKRKKEGAASGKSATTDLYSSIISWFEKGNTLELSDTMTTADYEKALDSVDGLRNCVTEQIPAELAPANTYVLMEFVLDGLHQFSKIAKDDSTSATVYKDMVGSIFQGGAGEDDDY